MECGFAKDERRRHIPKYGSIKSSLYRERRKYVPKQPDIAPELVLPEQWTQTLTNESFLLTNVTHNSSRIVVFGTVMSLKRVCQSEVLYMDGTFNVCPRFNATGN